MGERPQARAFFRRARFAPRLDPLRVLLRDRRRDRLPLLSLLDRPRLEECDDVEFDDRDEDCFLFAPMVNGLCDFVCAGY